MKKKKSIYNKMTLFSRLDSLENKETVTSTHNEELNLLYRILNNNIRLDSEGILNLDMQVVDGLEDLVNDYFHTGNPETNELTTLIAISDLREVIAAIKAKVSCATDQDFF